MARTLRFSCDVTPIDSDGGRATKSECFGHGRIRDLHFMNLSRHAISRQNLLESQERRWMMWALGHVENFNLQFALSCLARFGLPRSGQRAERLCSSFLQLPSAARSSFSSL